MPKTDTIQFWVLNIASFVAQLTIAMVNLALVYHLRGVFSLAAHQIGIASSIAPSAYLICCIVGVKHTAHFRPRHLVEVSLLGMALSIAILAVTRTLGIAYLALILFGAFMSLLWPQIEGWFSRGKEGAALNRVVNGFNFSWSLGVGLSSYIAGLLVEISTTLAFGVAIALFVAVFLIIAIASNLVVGIRAVDSEVADTRRMGSQDRSTVLRYWAWTGIVILYSGMSIILTIFPLYAQDVLGLSESHTGALLLIRGVTTCLSFLVLGKLHFWHFKKRWIFLAQLGFALLCLAARGLSSPPGWALFFFIFGCIFALAYDQSMFHGVSGAVHRARRMIIHEVLLTVGTIAGAVGGGAIYERLSFASVLTFFGLVALIILAVELITAPLVLRRAK